MRYLVIDTATKIMYVALIENNKITHETTRIAQRDHSKYLVSYIESLFNKAAITINDLDGIIVGAGPGSYTGLRIAGVVAKTLAVAKNIKLYQISSLLLLTSGYSEVVAMIDARNDFVFGAIYHDGLAIVHDNHFKKTELLIKTTNEKIILIDENNFKINAKRIIDNKVLVENPHSYVPNYINKPEAERHGS